MIDFCNNESAVQLVSELDNVLQQMEIFLDTQKNEVLGEDFGNDFDKFLFDVNAGNGFTARYIENAIRSNVDLGSWDLSVNVTFLMGNKNDIMIIHLKLSNGVNILEKNYKMKEGSVYPVY